MPYKDPEKRRAYAREAARKRRAARKGLMCVDCSIAIPPQETRCRDCRERDNSGWVRRNVIFRQQYQSMRGDRGDRRMGGGTCAVLDWALTEHLYRSQA